MRESDWRPQPAFHHAVTDTGQLDFINAGGGLAVSFAPPGKSVHLSFEGSQSKTLSVWRTESRSGFMTKPKMEAELVTIRFVDRGAMVQFDRKGRDRIAGPSQAILTSFDAMRIGQATPGFCAISATVGRDAVIAACRAMFGPDSATVPVFESVVDVQTPGLMSVRATIESLQKRLVAANDDFDMITPLLQEVLLYQLVGNWPLLGRPSSERTPDPTGRAVRRAIDFIEGNLQRAVTLRDIAQAAGLSVRGLQSAFKRRIGCSPIQYLIARRLDRVHADLLADDGDTISASARRWGFVHMSDFSARYRARFGCLPREARR
jgi:AraC-like DNA-binding protein